MNDLIELSVETKKDISTIKQNNGFCGVIRAEKTIYITTETFPNALQAANSARALRKKYKIAGNIKKKETTESLVKLQTTKPTVLLTEFEMANSPDLRVKEVWVLFSPNKKYIKTALSNSKVVTYTTDKTQAQVFNTYEEAAILQKTLDVVLQKGHILKRFFLRLH